MLVRNPWSTVFSNRVAFADMAGKQASWTADRTEFLGRLEGLALPEGLARTTPLSGRTGAGLDPCAALQTVIELEVGETVEVVAFIGQCASADEARDLIARYRAADLDGVLSEVTNHWDELLGAVKVKTPDRSMDIMLNGWLLYQTLACRIWARSAFTGERYLGLSLISCRRYRPHVFAAGRGNTCSARRSSVRRRGHADRWLPHSGQGVRTRISDDRVWLAYAAATYVATAGDPTVLDEVIPFLDGPSLQPTEPDAFFQPMLADKSASLFEHCCRGLDQAVALTGEHGLPLMGTGDWNDGMNRVGEGGKGESVWLGWLLLRTIELFAPFADTPRSRTCSSLAGSLRNAPTIARTGCLGWRLVSSGATFDDGSWLGSGKNKECRINSIAQSWAVLSGGADPARAATAMASLDKRLVRRDDGLALLFTPPFNKTRRDPGYIKGYPPQACARTVASIATLFNGAILAFAKVGRGDKAHDLFSLVNPINHASTPEAVERYKVEPYVVAADVYSVAPHVGRGGWPRYTGSAGWMYRAGLEGILWHQSGGWFLSSRLPIPAAWSGFEAAITIDSTRYDISVTRTSSVAQEDAETLLDGQPILPVAAHALRVPLDGAHHTLSLRLA